MSDGIEVTTHERPGAPILPARRPDPCVMVIFGATGDLAERKLLPALYNLAREGNLPDNFAVAAFSRSARDTDAYRQQMRAAVEKFSRSQPIDDAVWNKFAARIECSPGTFDDAESFQRLKTKSAELDEKFGCKGNRLFYFATPASAFPVILKQLAAAKLISPAPKAHRPWTRVVVEKPFGHDLESAKALNALLGKSLEESQIYRIDHYLGKETVQNIMVFRFANSIFEPLWNHHYVDHVEITAAEQIGIEGRGKFYDETGVIRDVVQNHLLQVMAMVAMEPPVSFAADDVRDEKNKVFRALRPISGREVGEHVAVGQYEGYRAEEGVRPDSQTPTYVALKCYLDNWRWQNVPFYIRAGKSLAKRLTEVSIHFKRVPHCLFTEDDVCQRLEPNVLTLRIQPREGIMLDFETKVPGEDLSISGVTMDFSYADAFHKQAAEAYERLLLDCMRGSATLFARRDQVEEAWKFVTPILEALESGKAGPVASYAKGSSGPKESDVLIRRDGRRWSALK